MFHEAWKLTIITEKTLEDKLSQLLLEQGCKGFTLFNVAGRGLHHFHAPVERGFFPEEFTEIQFEAILRDRARAQEIAEKVVKDFLDVYAGIVFLERVEVVRSERF